MKAIVDYYVAGATVVETAKHFHKSKHMVSKILDNAGVKRSLSESRVLVGRRNQQKAVKLEIMLEYLSRHRDATAETLKKHFGVSSDRAESVWKEYIKDYDYKDNPITWKWPISK